MFKCALPVVVCVFLLIASPALAGPSVDKGSAAPEIAPDRWLNLPKGIAKVSPKDLKGQIVMVEFFATTCGPCRQSIPHLRKIQERYAERGVVLLALSQEHETKLAPFIKYEKINYIVGCEAKETFLEYEVEKIPTLFVIDPDGKIVYRGNKPGEAETAVGETLKEKPPKLAASIFAEGAAADAYKRAVRLYKKKRYAKALKAFEKIVKDFKGTEGAEKARAGVEKIKANKKVMAKIRKTLERKTCELWLSSARSLAKQGEKKKAAEYYNRVLEEYPDSQYATEALKGLAEL